MKNKILHIMMLDKFNVPFMNFIKEHFDISNHKFIFLHQPKYEHGMTKEHNVTWIYKKNKFFQLLKELYLADKIIIHGLWSERLLQILLLQPWLLKKCYHVMWGGDYYFPEKQSWLKKQVIKKMGHFITSIKGDYELAQKWYGSKGKYHECFMYPSNLYKEYDIKPKKHTTVNIQLGNSADPTNNHVEVLQRLLKYKDKDIKIYAPLSYGDQDHAKKVIIKGKKLFGEKFIPITEFMPFDKYLEFLSSIDIAIFAHNRQQAMGNTITLLGLGKKVYIDPETVHFEFLNKHKLNIFNVNEISLDPLEDNACLDNKQKIKSLFSKEVLISGLRKIFDE